MGASLAKTGKSRQQSSQHLSRRSSMRRLYGASASQSDPASLMAAVSASNERRRRRLRRQARGIQAGSTEAAWCLGVTEDDEEVVVEEDEEEDSTAAELDEKHRLRDRRREIFLERERRFLAEQVGAREPPRPPPSTGPCCEPPGWLLADWRRARHQARQLARHRAHWETTSSASSRWSAPFQPAPRPMARQIGRAPPPPLQVAGGLAPPQSIRLEYKTQPPSSQRAGRRLARSSSSSLLTFSDADDDDDDDHQQQPDKPEAPDDGFRDQQDLDDQDDDDEADSQSVSPDSTSNHSAPRRRFRHSHQPGAGQNQRQPHQARNRKILAQTITEFDDPNLEYRQQQQQQHLLLLDQRRHYQLQTHAQGSSHAHQVACRTRTANSIQSTAQLSSRSASTWSEVSNRNNNTRTKKAMTSTPRQELGLALSLAERDRRGVTGLLPAAIRTQQQQVNAVMKYLDGCQDELAKYVYLRNLKDFNERLFYASLVSNVERLMPLVYTPTVGLACQRFSEIYFRPRGLFITAAHAGRVDQVLANWPEPDVRVIVVTDGERILGLGDLGANGMGISIGKLSLYTALAGIPPQNVLPVVLDVGTNNQSLLDDPLYIGLRQRRVKPADHQRLVDEFMAAVVGRYGRSCLIQFEDFGNSTAFGLLQRHRNQYCTFNDDIQGTASVCLSGLISASRLGGRRLADCSFLFYGAGEANLGTAQLLVMALADDGLTREEALKRIWLVDSRGLIVRERRDLSEHKRHFARDAKPIFGLEEIVKFTKPAAIIGASAQPKSFTKAILSKMADFNERPIVFALSNPTSKAECTADEAFRFTKGRCIFASGSPFEPVEYDGKTFVTGQGNNAYIFPAVGLAAIGAHVHTVPEDTFLVAARALSDQLKPEDAAVGLVYPSLSRIREVTLKVACRVLEFFYSDGIATFRPEPQDKEAFLKGLQYDGSYESTSA